MRKFYPSYYFSSGFGKKNNGRDASSLERFIFIFTFSYFSASLQPNEVFFSFDNIKQVFIGD